MITNSRRNMKVTWSLQNEDGWDKSSKSYKIVKRGHSCVVTTKRCKLNSISCTVMSPHTFLYILLLITERAAKRIFLTNHVSKILQKFFWNTSTVQHFFSLCSVTIFPAIQLVLVLPLPHFQTIFLLSSRKFNENCDSLYFLIMLFDFWNYFYLLWAIISYFWLKKLL